MYSKEFPQISEPVEELWALLKRVRDARLRLRLHMLILIQEGRVATRAEATEILAVHRNSITNWLRLYEQGGLERLLEVKTGGPERRQKTLPDDVYADLKTRVADGQFSTYTAARDWLLEEHGLNVLYRTVHSIIRYRMGVDLKRERKRRATPTE